MLGEIFRSRAQIRFLAEKLLNGHVKDAEKVQPVVDFLCADSGSHDYTINRREAEALGLPVEKPSAAFYATLSPAYSPNTRFQSARERVGDGFDLFCGFGTASRDGSGVIQAADG